MDAGLTRLTNNTEWQDGGVSCDTSDGLLSIMIHLSTNDCTGILQMIS